METTTTNRASRGNPDSVKQESPTQTGHTPGPWYALGKKVQKDYGDKAYVIAAVNDHEEASSDARLIAAAPALLEALQEVVAASKERQRIYVNSDGSERMEKTVDEIGMNVTREILAEEKSEKAIALATGKDAAHDTN